MTEPHSSRSQVQVASLQDVTLPSFSISHEQVGRELIVRMRGNADSDVAEAFAQFLRDLHDEAVRLGVREVVLDFRELYFLTSSCIKGLVVAIKRVMAMEAKSQYKIRLLTSPALRWQERSFEVLCQLAPLLVSMTPD